MNNKYLIGLILVIVILFSGIIYMVSFYSASDSTSNVDVNLNFSTSAEKIYTTSSDQTVREITTSSYEQGNIFNKHTNSVLDVTYNPDRNELYSVSSDETLRVIDAESFEQINVIRNHDHAVQNALYDKDHIYTVSSDSTARKFDIETYEQVSIIEDFDGSVMDSDLDGSRNQMVTVSFDETVKFIDLDSFEITKTIHFDHSVVGVDYNDDLDMVAVVGKGNLYVIDRETDERLIEYKTSLEDLDGENFDVYIDESNESVYTGNYIGQVLKFDINSGEKDLTKDIFDGEVRSIEMDENRTAVYATGGDRTYRQMNTELDQQRVFNLHENRVIGMEIVE